MLDTVWQEQVLFLRDKKRTVMEKITLRISKKLKQELIQIAHQKGMVLNEYLNILLVNKIL